MKTPGDPVGSQLYGTPSPFEKDVVRNVPKNGAQYISAASRTPLQDLDGIITPNGLFYERHHGGIPAIDPAQHRLMLHGLVDRPMIFTMDDIRRFPSQSRIHFLECSGNLSYKKPFGKTASDLVGLLSCAEWTGVSLKLVLQEAGLQAGAKWIVAEGRRCRGADPQHSYRKMSRRCDAGVQPERRAAASAAGLSAAAAAARLRGQHECEMVAPAEGRVGAGLFAGGDLEIYRPDAGRHGAGIHLLHGGEVHHHPAVGRTEARQSGLPSRLPALPGAGMARSSASTYRSTAAKAGRKRNCRSRFSPAP